MTHSSLVELLRARAAEHPREVGYTFLADGEEEAGHLTYADLDRRARAIGAALRGAGAEGRPVLLLFPPGLEFVAAFLGCLYGGAAAVPAYPPRSRRTLPRLRSIVRDAEPAAALATAELLGKLDAMADALPELATGGERSVELIATDELDASEDGLAGRWSDPGAGPETLAFLQYTSGSTAAPKGVQVTHGNLLHNEEMIRRAFGQSEESLIVGWLPLYHDMGLIGNVLQPLYVRARCVLMAPVAFLQKPVRWLRAIDRYRATTSGGPNFAYDLCARKVRPEEREELDLSSWTVAYNGAEPIRADTLDRFAAAFAPAGFRREAFYPCYGLAEATLFVTGGARKEEPVVAAVEPEALERGEARRAGEGDGRRLVGCGTVWADQEVVVADPETSAPLGDGRVGEIWVRGPSVADGYWRRPEVTEAEFYARLASGDRRGEGPFLRTGDLGFLRGGELFVTGRLKDLIILRGRNLYPQDVERTAEVAHPALRSGCGAAFALQDEGGDERLALVQEVHRHHHKDLDADEVADAIRMAVAAEHDASVDTVVLIRHGTILKTSSGKIRRRACREALLAGELREVGRSRMAAEAEEEAGAPGLDDFLELTGAERERALASWVGDELARAAGVDRERLSGDAPLALDSLAAMELKARIDAALEIDLALETLIEEPTPDALVAELAAALDRSVGGEGDGDEDGRRPARTALPPVRAAAEPPARGPLSWGQRALWLESRLAPESAAYNVVFAARVRSGVDPEALGRTLELLARRHPALTLAVETDGGAPVQRFGAAPVDYRVVDASGLEPDALRERLDRAVQEPFDLEAGPVARARLFDGAPGGPVFVLTVHHIAVDLWSLVLLLDELGRAYPELAAGREPVLGPAPVHPADAVAWQERLLESERGEAMADWWEERLAGAPQVLELPTDRPRPTVRTDRAGTVRFGVDRGTADRLAALARGEGATPYMVLLAAFGLLLGRHAGQDELLVGSPAAGRPRPELQDLVGYLVNPLPLRLAPGADTDFRGFLRAVRETVLGALRHETYPFLLLAERLAPERDAGRTPLFQTLFVLERPRAMTGGSATQEVGPFILGDEGARMSLGGLDLESVAVDTGAAQLDLTLTLVESPVAGETGEELAAELRYNADLFDPTTVRRLARQWVHLLETVVEAPDRRLAELSLLTPSQEHQVRLEWNDAAEPVPADPRERLIHRAFFARAERTPEAPAVTFGDRRLSYGALATRVRELAGRLRTLPEGGVGPDTRVGVFAERSPEMVAAMLAILAAGGAYVPLDPSYPPERVALMLEDSGARAVLTQERLAGKLPEAFEGAVVLLDGAEPERPLHPIDGTEADPDNLAYMIYTSGSTGRPKGVQVPHRTAMNYLRGTDLTVGYGPGDRMLAVTTISFDISVLEILGTLTRGAEVVLVEEEAVTGRPVVGKGGEADVPLAAVARRRPPTLFQCTPSMMAMVMADRRAVEALECLETLILGGEAMPPGLARDILRELPRTRLVNIYGPTETTVWSSTREVESVSGPISIGRPLVNTRLYVVDPRGLPVPPGAAGELLIGGEGVTRGYLGRPGLTAERFVPDPFGPQEGAEPGGRLYRTGDLVRHRPDGALDFLGRLDFQVKIRGNRIELGEIEAALGAHPEIREAVALARAAGGEGDGDLRLVAYVVGEGGSAPDPDRLLEALGKTLPDYMVPSVVVVLDALPLTPNGKVDRRALPAPEHGAERTVTPPRTATEERLAEMFREVLAIEDEIGVEESFFRLGGHSLLATQLASRVGAAFGVDLPLREVFEHSTIAALAAHLDAASGRPVASGPPPLRPLPRTAVGREDEADRFPASFAQERLWFLDRLEPGGATYNLAGALLLEGELHLPALAAALGRMVRRQESLRTTFDDGERGALQVVAGALEPRLPVVDLGTLAPVRRDATLHDLIAREARTPFDLVRGPLFRCLVLRTGPREHALVVNLHHIVADGWSLDVFLRDLGADYGARVEGRSADLPELPIQYADWAVWQREWLEDDGLDEQIRSWREELADAPGSLDLPVDRPRPPRPTSRGSRRRVVFTAEVTRGLEALAAREGGSRFMALLALFDTLLFRLSGQTDLVVGTPIAGRDRRETEGLVGLFLNTLALRLSLAGEGLTFRQLLGRAREVTLAAYDRADVPFERLVAELAPDRESAGEGLFQVLLVENNAPVGAPELPGLVSRVAEADTGTSKFDLVLTLAEVGRGEERRLEGRLRYREELFDATTVDRIGRRLGVLARAVVGDPDRPLDSLPLLAPAERQQLVEWNDTVPARTHEGTTLPELIARRAEQTPDRTAVAAEGTWLTYGSLIERAERVAARLRASVEGGVGPETRVAICAERSVELVVALLGVLRAGGAYVPIDPSYPEERLRLMVEDSGAPAVLVQRGLEHVLPGGSASGGGPRRLVLEEVAGRGDGAGTGAPATVDSGELPADLPESLAYVIYTSGSTGRPKGVMNSHRGIVNRLLWMQERYGLREDDRVLQKTPTSFDVSVWELFWPLLAGARLVMARPEGHKDPAYLAATLRDRGITTLHFVPSMLQAFVETPGLDTCRSVRRVIASGEALTRDLAERFFERMPQGAALENLYGPTEAAVDVTWWPCARGAEGGAVPIGRPVAATRVHVLDPRLRPVPPGVAGELCIGGVQVARGYLGRPGLTAERFVPDPLAGEPGRRLYRTGDLARHRPDGALEFLGRLDHQVKVRGFRIELGEIEAALAALPGVADATVLARPAPGGGSRLAAYVVPREGNGPEEELARDLRTGLAERLPEHMVPTDVVFVDRMPLTPSGKTDRRALARRGERAGAAFDPERAGAGTAVAGASRRERIRDRVAGLWEDVLGIPRPGPDDSFFELGGDSVRAAVAVNRLQQELDEIVHVVALFDHPTLDDFAAFVEAEYPQAVARRWGISGRSGAGASGSPRGGPAGEQAVAAMRRIVDDYRVVPSAGPKLRRAVFVLSPPRSGSTLLRVMLGGHPDLFAPPELELLTFESMGRRREAFSGRDVFWREGLVRAVMETHRCDAGRAEVVLAELEDAGAPTGAAYRELQERIGDRLLVDKTPSYALYRSVLERAEEELDEPVYVHLVRHPCAVIHSFEEARLDQVFFRHEHDFSRRELAELVWIVSHRNIAERFGLLPRERCLRVRFEDLVRHPEAELRRLCAHLGVDYHPAMADPYGDPEGRMIDGPREESRMLGDVKLADHRRIDPAAAERWRNHLSEEVLGVPARELAAALGYEVAPLRRAAGAVPVLRRRFGTAPGTRLPVSFSQERLWFLEQLDPGTGVYNMPGALSLTGELEPAALHRAFGEVVRRHGVLRSRFRDEDGVPYQVVEPARAPSLPVVDLSALPEPARREAVEIVGRVEARRPFDLAEPPFLRTLLLRRGARDHVVLATMHHIASDGWSIGVLAREMAAFYPRFAGPRGAGKEPALPEPPLQYADYAAWHREWLEAGRLDDQLDHWRQRLEGAPRLLELPADRPRPPRPSHRGAVRHATLPAPLAEGLRARAEAAGGTLFMALLAGLDILLARLSGQRDLVVGTPVANRPRKELEGLIGFFVNTLPLRADLSGDPGFAGLVEQARSRSLEAFEHQDLPFERLVGALQPERDTSHAPIFQVMLVLQNAPQDLRLPGLHLELLEPEAGTARFDLTFVVTEAEDGSLGVTLDYARDLFDATTAERTLARLRTVLEAAVREPEAPVSRLPLLGAAERAQVLTEWNDRRITGEESEPSETWFHRRVARWAEVRPDAVALVSDGEDGPRVLTYDGLQRRVGLLARRLAGLGVGPESVVGVATGRSPELVIGVLATLEAGGAWLPLDPSYPEERLRFMIEDALTGQEPRVVLALERHLGALPEHRGETVLLDDAGEVPEDGPEPRLEPSGRVVSGDAPAYVIYTSGTTGRPKGVVLTHRGLANLCAAEGATYALEPDERVLQFASASFDASVFELVSALHTGGQIHLADGDALLPGPPLLGLLRRRRITAAILPPSTLAALPSPDEAALPAFATLTVAGEACPPELAREWIGAGAGRAAGGRLFNGYGPTEAAVWSTLELYDDPREPISIGRAAPNDRIHLLDREMEPVPIGVPGELHIGSPGLARGYRGRPGLTAERFVPDPFAGPSEASGAPGDRVYKTGDLARRLPDGRLDFLGRIDHQVKLRGFRIELGEIEAALADQPAVAEAAVLLRDELPGGPGLVAYVTPEPGEEAPAEESLRRGLGERLPEYMVPGVFLVLDAMPRTPAGKVDREALPIPADRPAAAAWEPPRGPVEEGLAAILSEVLGLGTGDGDGSPVGRHDSFFDLGGHSLLAARVTARVGDRFGVELPVRRLFERPTVAALAAEVAALEAAGAAAELPPIEPVPRGEAPHRFPTSFSQERLWFLDRLQPGETAYNIPQAARLTGRLDPAALARALGAIAERHESLRTTFATEEGAPVQVVAASAHVPLPLVDLEGLAPEVREAEARCLAAAEAKTPFDLTAGPLLRTALVRLAAGGGEDEHVLLLDVHHAVSDGWSMGVLIHELGALYRAFLGEGLDGGGPDLDPLPVQYADYAVWQREWLAGETLERQVAFWRERLDGAPGLLELPTDRPRPAVQSFRGGTVPVRLDRQTGAGLERLARERGATPFMILLALFQALLSRLSGQDDLAVGTPVANRRRVELEGLIGFFVNTLVMRADLAGDPSFADLVDRVRTGALEGFARQDLPFEKLVEKLAPERSLAHSPLIQVLFVLQNAPVGPLELPGVALEPLRDEEPAAKFDLTLTLFERAGGGFGGTLDFARDLYDRTTAVRFARHLETLASEAVRAPGRPFAALPLLTAVERLQLAAWNDTARPLPEADSRIEELVAAQARRTPDRLAVSGGGEALTYAGLVAHARSLAARLRRLGVGAETPVAVCVERSVDLVAALLGVFGAGGAYVPLDPTHPPERLAGLIEDSDISVLVARERLLEEQPALDRRLRSAVAHLVPVAGARAAVDEEPVPARAVAGPDSLAYVIYTSGSTGRPKGVMNAHRGVVNRLLWMREMFGLDGDRERVLQKTPYTFDVSVWELFAPLAAGAHLVMARPGGHGDPSYLARTLVDERITLSHFVPSMLRAFVETPEAAACGAPLERVIASGEALPPDLVRRFAETVGARLYNLYGPTEAAIEVTWWPCGDEEGGTVPIGRPLANTRIHVVDAGLRPVPAGVPGELLIGGVQVARGYLGQPAKTAESFVPDPFVSGDGGGGGRLYRSGDLARLRPDGAVEFLGRLDHQVKVRGFRIELGEIEAALGNHPMVREAVVVAREDRGERRLVAYVTADGEDENAPSESELKAFLGERLPEYMVPAACVRLDRFPLTASGKVDRKALPAPDWTGGRGGEDFVAPRGPAEETMARIWSEVLGVERIDARDGFFELGGHSLLATRLVSRVREVTGVDLPVRAVFEAPTLEGLAARIAPHMEGAGFRGPGTGAAAAAIEPLGADERSRGVPLSFSQERLWFLDRLEPGSPWYNLPAALRLRGTLDRMALAAALAEIVRRHEVLRTVFVEADGDGDPTETGAPVQRVLAPPVGGLGRFGRPLLPEIDLSRLPRRRREALLAELATDEAARPFDLAAGPLLRATLVRASAADHALLVTAHHIVSDGWSNGVLLRELGTCYAAFSGRRPAALAELPALPIQYGDFAVWQRRELSGGALDAQLDGWRERLEGAPAVLELPTDRPRPAVRKNRGGQVPVRLTAAAAAVDRLAREEGASRFMVLAAAWAQLLARLAGQEDVVVGTPVAGRERPEVEPLIGFFVNTLPIRARTAGTPSFRGLVGRLRAAALDAFSHQDVPFERLVEELRPVRDPSHTPIFQVAFALQDAPLGGVDALAGAGLETEPFEPEGRTAKFDLTLTLVERDGRIAGGLEYDRDLFDRTTARRLAGQLDTLLAGALAAPEHDAAGLPLLGPAERHQVTVAWNDTTAAYPRDETVDGLFRRVAAAVPDAVAIEEDGERLTYGALERRADRLARRLTRRLDALDGGPGANVPVALAVERSADLIVAMLGTLMAGAWYLPLDRSYPEERLVAMLEDAGARVVVARPGEVEALSGVWSAPAQNGDRRTESRSPEVVVLGSGDGESEGEDASPSHRPPGAPSPLALAYAMYTSGSTGKPKGVAIPHRGIARLVLGTDYVDLGPGDRVAHAANPSFDAATFEIWGPLLTGGTVVCATRGEILEPDRLARWVASRRLDSLFLTTALFDQVAAEAPEAFAPLREVLFGGEAVDPSRVREVLDAAPPERLLHVYGPTESTTYATWFRVDAVPAGAVTVPIGRPIANTRTFVLDPRTGRPVPPGVGGELVIAGDGLARGYLGRPALTAERFTPDPVSRPDGRTEAGGRIYRTGDLVRLRGDGAVEFLGRIDHQVKIRGFRIEPGEVEAALGEEARVREATVVPWDDPRTGRQELVAYLALEDAGDGPDRPDGTVEAVRTSLRERLPEFMVPGLFVVLDELPLNPNGKVDRRALAAIDPLERAVGRAAAGATAATAPRTPAEERLAELWAEVLGVEQVGVESDFFDLGGHSLLATRVVARVRKELGVEVPLRTLFERPTVAGLAAAIEGAAKVDEVPLEALARISGREGDPELPLSFSQQRLWFLDRLEPASGLYNIPAAFRARGPLDPGRLAGALRALVRRHEVLRTTFPERDGVPVQRIRRGDAVPLPMVDLGGLRESAREAEGRRLAAAEAARPFHLERGPLLRALLVRDAADAHLFLVTQHHIVSDGWSVGILLAELSSIYRDGAEADLPELPIQYADYAAWQRERLTGAALERRLEPWRRWLAGVPPLALPTDRPRPTAQTYEGAARSIRLAPELAARVRALGRERGATLFMTLLAVFELLLARHAGQDDFAVGTPVAGRERADLEPLIGFFVNTLALRADLSGEPTFAELLARARSTALDAFAHQEVPFERLVEELVPDRDLARPPIFQAAFALQRPPEAPELPGIALEPLELAKRDAKFELGLAAVDRGSDGAGGIDLIELSLGFNTDLFDGARIERMLEHLRSLLEAAAEDPDRPAAALPLLSAPERHQLLVEWNHPTPGLPLGAGPWSDPPSPLALFAARVEATPDAVAVVQDGDAIRVLTYRELDRRARRVAAHLRGLVTPSGRPVGPDTLVAVCVERSADLLAALLGVLRAGAAYLPLDPSYPRERLAFMVENSGVELLLADRTSADALPAPDDLGVERVDLEGLQGFQGFQGFEAPGGPEAAAYVIYTSGSTGVPKGIVNCRRALGNLLADRSLTAVGPDDRVLHKTPVSFDASVFEILSPLVSGGTAVLARPGGEQDPAYLARLMAAERVTVTGSTPSMLATLLEQPGIAACRSLRRMATGSEAVPLELAERYAALDLSDLYNLYGPTETTVAVLEWRARPGRDEGTLPIGRPIAGARVYLLDAGGCPVPAGVPGEVVIGGPTLARGYLARPSLTAERYLPDPFVGVPGTRMYRTGDLARRRHDGAVEFIGRIDRQVQVRGFRVELGEIEDALTELPEVREAAVLAREVETEATRRLVAYLAPAGDGAEPGEPLTVGELRERLAERLPEYMVPSAFVVLDELPLAPSGKVDRDALARIEPGREDLAPERSVEHVAPRDDLEARLAAIWEDLVEAERVGVRDDFFELGGHSLLAVRLVSRIAEETGRELPVAALFRAPTVEGLAALVRSEAGEPGEGSGPLVRLAGPVGSDVAEPAPLFLVHAVGGSVFSYRELAGRLARATPSDGARRAVYGLESPLLGSSDGDGDEPAASVEELAAGYLKAVRAARPEGPYHLGGWSFGALVAWEMARRLVAEGTPSEEVSIVLIDPSTPGGGADLGLDLDLDGGIDDPRGVAFLGRDLAALSGAEPPVTAEELAAEEPERRLDLLVERAGAAGLLPPDVGVERVRRIAAVYHANACAAATYRPEPDAAAPARVLGLFADESPGRAERATSWSALAGGAFDERSLPGDHYTLLRIPHVEALADLLGDWLAEARAEEGRELATLEGDIR